MFREMRRKDRSIGKDEIHRILRDCEYGLLATMGDGEFPYATPYNYIYMDEKIYLHYTNQDSHKRDDIRINPNVCFTVVGETELIPEKFATSYESVIIFGVAKEIEDGAVKRTALELMVKKYSPEYQAEGIIYIDKMYHATAVLEITPVHMTGKVRKRAGRSNLEYLEKNEH